MPFPFWTRLGNRLRRISPETAARWQRRLLLPALLVGIGWGALGAQFTASTGLSPGLGGVGLTLVLAGISIGGMLWESRETARAETASAPLSGGAPPSVAQALALRPSVLGCLEPELCGAPPRPAHWDDEAGDDEPGDEEPGGDEPGVSGLSARRQGVAVRGWCVAIESVVSAGFEGPDTLYWFAWDTPSGILLGSWRDTSDAMHGGPRWLPDVGDALSLLLVDGGFLPDTVVPYCTTAPWVTRPFSAWVSWIQEKGGADTSVLLSDLVELVLFASLHQRRAVLSVLCTSLGFRPRNPSFPAIRDDGLLPVLAAWRGGRVPDLLTQVESVLGDPMVTAMWLDGRIHGER